MVQFTRNLLSPAALARFFVTAAIGVALDQWTKVEAFRRLLTPPYDQQGYKFIPGYVHFLATENPGAVFGLGKGHLELFIAVSVLAIGFIAWLFLNSGRQPIYQIVLGMLLAGVIGNLYDRVEFGHVRDMILIFHRWGIFPYVFNVADSLLCTGVTIMIVYSLFQPPRHGVPAPKISAGADANPSKT